MFYKSSCKGKVLIRHKCKDCAKVAFHEWYYKKYGKQIADGWYQKNKARKKEQSKKWYWSHRSYRLNQIKLRQYES